MWLSLGYSIGPKNINCSQMTLFDEGLIIFEDDQIILTKQFFYINISIYNDIILIEDIKNLGT